MDKPKTKFTVTVEGTYVDDDGMEHVVAQSYKDINGLYMAAITMLDNGMVMQDSACIGGFSMYIWCKVLKSMAETVGPNDFLVILKEALMEIFGDDDGKKDQEMTPTP